MARKPTDTRNFTLRIRETLGRRLEAAAQKNRQSLNVEIRQRLEASFEAQARRDLEDIVSDLNQVLRASNLTVSAPVLGEPTLKVKKTEEGSS